MRQNTLPQPSAPPLPQAGLRAALVTLLLFVVALGLSAPVAATNGAYFELVNRRWGWSGRSPALLFSSYHALLHALE